MNKISKRIVAGASAAVLLVSAVDTSVFTNLFTRAVSAGAASSAKNAKSTGFGNLEQDTDKDGNYNTGYGLHTNKTAEAVGDDGRTFDVNLESWYVGENPVDVATVLDASGSMAWTVNTLSPLEISNDQKYIDSLAGKEDYNGDGNHDINDLIDFQNDNGGYLPQEAVDKILEKTNTDNTKLGYDGYKYYVYEARPSVSEFVPLGYWDGGADPKNDESLIGYYPFSGDLKNKAPKATEGAEGMLINHPASGGTYNTSEKAAETLKAEFSTQEVDVLNSKGKPTGDKETVVKGLNIADSSSKGAILIDSPKTNKFSISFEMSIDQNTNGFDDATILYLTDGENSYRIYRAGNTSPNRLKITTSNNKTLLNANNATNSEPRKWTFTFDFTEKKLKIDTDTDNVLLDNVNKLKTYTVDLSKFPQLDIENLKIYIGGDTEEHKNQNNIYIKNLSIKNITAEGETEVANYPLQTEENGLKNTVEGGKKPIFVEQAYNNSGNFGETEIGTHLLEPVFKDNKALDLNATSKLGAVMLDVVPDIESEKGFTISMKLQKNSTKLETVENNQRNIFYLGSKDTSKGDYLQFYRSALNGGNLVLSKKFDSKPLDSSSLYYQGGLDSANKWYTNTLVFKPLGDDKFKVTPYVDGNGAKLDSNNKLGFPNGGANNGAYNVPESFELSADDIVLLLGALSNNSTEGAEHYIDDLYIFNNALNETQVAQYFGEKELCKGSTTDKKLYHATTVDNQDIAQISESLANNAKSDERRGWYYVNSHSTWADVTGCLASGKQYIGIKQEEGTSYYSPEDKVTIPSGMDPKLIKDIENYENNSSYTKHADYEAPKTERSIRFYVDEQSHLRCFVWSGADSKENDPRTFCSLVYEKADGQKTKYEELNSALNTFYRNLASYSDLSNTSVVRFSTINAVDKSNTGTTDTNLKKLIMNDWTNWSDYYQAVVGKETPDTNNYLQDLLKPADDEKSTDTTTSEARKDILEYPYVMTGGTYTWTGLKAFYDNMVKKDKLSTGDKVYDIANDARDKYLILFTDGRDNTQDYDVSKIESKDDGVKLAGSPDYSTGDTFKDQNYVDKYNPYKGESHKVGFSIENYDDYKGEKTDYYYSEWQVQEFKTGDHTIQYDGDLAQAWADKLKDEGYTIYCVMLATGSISESANKDEYNKAKNFLKSLSGGEKVDEEIAEKQADMDNLSEGTKPDEYAGVQEEIEELKDNYVIVVDPTTTTGTNSLEAAFQKILEDIQQPRDDYNVQDYIDPRFDLIGKVSKSDYDSKPHEVIYHLGANGNVTFTNKNNNPIENITVDTGKGTVTLNSGVKIGNIIDDEKAIGIPYIPQDSYMVNRTKYEKGGKEYYTDGDGIGTGYIYYDNENDMYYLRWDDQVIPMEDEAFDTAKNGKKLNVWSSTIRLKAKEDFIGGNNILTNGNEAGENLVYSDATIENMDNNPEVYFTEDELEKYADSEGKYDIPYRKKLEVLSGTNRKINAVDAGGVSQAVYGDGIDIPSSGFPRTTVNVRLKPLDAKNLNDVIYMGEVVSPTMMLADLENDYMTGSYYLEYLERYAYRLYGKDTDKTPLLDLLNEWLKINNKEETSKTFTIPYIYLPDPVYENDKLKIDEDTKRVEVSNSTGASWDTLGNTNFDDLNLRDVTGFITYTWKRDDDSKEKQQEVIKDGETKYDITKEYVVKNTEQIVYNLQLKFTPLHEGELSGFDLDDEKFITAETTGGLGDKFFMVDTTSAESAETYYEFVESTDEKWEFTKRSDYLKAMVSEKQTYIPHVEYNSGTGKWQLKDTTSAETVSKDIYDWDADYKEVVGDVQIDGDKLNDYYTKTLNNVGFADKDGNTITDKYGAFTGTNNKDNVCSLVANTTYTKDVVNGALALELVVDGRYLGTDSIVKAGKEYKFTATRYYDDPIDPLPYGGGTTTVNADTGSTGKEYQLTFTVDSKTLPGKPEANQLYTVWANLTDVKVQDSSGNFVTIKGGDDTYAGYTDSNALPIGTYVIDTANNPLTEAQFIIGTNELGTDVNFAYLKTDNAPASYTYDKFPDSVYNVSKTASETTGDGEYLINNKNDNAPKNIAESSRVKDSDKQTLTFYFGTVESAEINGEEITNTKGESRIDNPENDYAKDRLGIMLLSVDPNSLAISKTVMNTDDDDNLERFWEFTVRFKPDSGENLNDFISKNATGFELKWYKNNNPKKADEMGEYYPSGNYPTEIKFTGSDGSYTAKLYLKHNEKVVISGLQEGTWQVTETDERKNSVGGGTGIFYSAHNNMDEFEDHQFSNMTNEDISLNPASHVDFVNEFPIELPSTGGIGTSRYIVLGTMFTGVSVLLITILWYSRRKRRTTNE